jgi:hypothetical protein
LSYFTECLYDIELEHFIDYLIANHFLPSETISSKRPCLHDHLLNRAEATVRVDLSGIATSLTNFENASVIQSICFLPIQDVLRGPNKSSCTLLFGIVQCSKGEQKFVVDLLSLDIYLTLANVC